ncbi:MAG: YihY/virulence factor BrkB family protein [Gemmatimonadetes bacterium]|nr:YihY/virulence factor BrkB family protein [Gemmatimonadota bacterium]NNF12673.1 YihY/virulence factor BrkB family protein [Gemmatimonadota bacterium]NNL29474.1 YihY/virulence factor BrkB family protein [Gemmatimonadota bacterium]
MEKCDDDEVFFLAGAVAFNLILAIFPLVLLGIGIAGFVLPSFGDPTRFVVGLLTDNLPQGAEGEITLLVESLVQSLLDGRTGFTIAGSIFLLWIATRLAASLRVGLRETFDIGAKRNPLHGKLFDVAAVMIGIVLLTLNLTATVLITSTVDYGVSFLGIQGSALSIMDRFLGYSISFLSIWTLLFLLYRYVPYRPIPFRTAVVAATFAAVAHESLKFAFSWYVTDIANFRTTLGNLATVGVFFFWIYYESLVFILGGEVAQVANMRKASRVGVETFEG